MMKRNVDNMNINNCNAHILRCLGSNMDLQYITDTKACVFYMCSYVTKPEKTMSDLLQAVAKEAHE